MYGFMLNVQKSNNLILNSIVDCDILFTCPLWKHWRLATVYIFRFRFRFIYLVILQTQETSAKTKSGRCRRGHLEKNKVYSIHVCTNNSNY